MRRYYGSFKILCQLLLGGVFIVAGLDKILHPMVFSDALRSYRILPTIMVPLISILLPWAELIFGAFLFIGIHIRFSSALLSVLLVVFSIAIFVSIMRGLNIECGCFPSAKSARMDSGYLLIIRNIFLFLLGLVTWRPANIKVVP